MRLTRTAGYDGPVPLPVPAQGMGGGQSPTESRTQDLGQEQSTKPNQRQVKMMEALAVCTNRNIEPNMQNYNSLGRSDGIVAALIKDGTFEMFVKRFLKEEDRTRLVSSIFAREGRGQA